MVRPMSYELVYFITIFVVHCFCTESVQKTGHCGMFKYR